MKRVEIDALIEEHLKAEAEGDCVGSVAMYTEDVEHDVVGSLSGPVIGREAAQAFYEGLTTNVGVEAMVPTHSY